MASTMTWGRAFFEVRPFLLLIALVTVATIHQTPGFYEPPGFMLGEEEMVDAHFVRCGTGMGRTCVNDGDTFRLGERRIRVVGIDTAERDARCPAEARQAEASTRALQEWLNRGPFTVVARLDDPVDRYGRELRIIRRTLPDGRVERLADFMRAEGGARRYSGGSRRDWC